VTLLISALPFIHFAYKSPLAHLALDTLASFVALLTAFLITGRFRQSRALADIVLVCALMLFGFTNLFFSVFGALAREAMPDSFSTWAPVSGRLLAAIALIAAAFLPQRKLRRPAHTGAALLLAGGALLAAIGVLSVVFAGRLPVGIDPGLSPEASGRPRVVGHPVVLALQLAAMVLFAAAAFGFTRRAERFGDELMKWFGAGAALAAAARLNYFLFPSLYSNYFYTGDVLRLGFYLLLLWGAGREISVYWRSLADVAVLEERRRMARDLHDGLGQELTFIWSQTRRFPERDAPLHFESVASAAERAIDESRRAIAALTMPVDQSLDAAIAQTATEVANRLGVRTKTDLEVGIKVSPETREGLLRIVREAVINAVRHGGAQTITVHLSDEDSLRLRIEDDGIGFDVATAKRNSRGFGLTSMQERAHSLGGELHIVSQPGAGTQIELRL
jgi:signal transduction histidine kinase